MQKLGELLPGYELSLAIAEGPFEDENGVGAHFEAKALQVGKPAKEGKKAPQVAGLQLSSKKCAHKKPV